MLYETNDINKDFFICDYFVDCNITDTKNKFVDAGLESDTYTKQELIEILSKLYPNKTLEEMIRLVKEESHNSIIISPINLVDE